MWKQDGFSLVEVMIAVVISAIFLALAIPSFNSLIERNQVSTITNDFIAALLLARSEAVTEETDMMVAKISEWKDGWTITDTANVEILRNTPTHNLIQIASVGDNVANSITYTPNGRTAVALVPGADYFRISMGDSERCIIFTSSGRPSSSICP